MLSPLRVNPRRRQRTIPAGLSNVVAIAGGGYHSPALRSDGTVAAWGESSSGQTTISAGVYLPAEINRRR
jgi:alpha-tubulin suppressor-like RCC1 family protein